MAQQGYEVEGLDELQETLNMLARLADSRDMARALFHGGLELERAVKLAIRKQHLILTGNYRTSIATEQRHDEVWIYTAVIYAAVHEFGATIKARNAPFLVFEYQGHLVRVKSVTIKARPHWRPAMKSSSKKIALRVAKTIDDLHRQKIRA